MTKITKKLINLGSTRRTMKKKNNLRQASEEQKKKLAILFGELLATLEKPLDKADSVY